MFSTKIMQSSLDDMKRITGADFAVTDEKGRELVTTFECLELKAESIEKFMDSFIENQEVSDDFTEQNYHFYGIIDEDEQAYCLLIKNSKSAVPFMENLGRMMVSQVTHLINASKERLDSKGFYQNLLLDNLLAVDIYNKANKLGIRTTRWRIIYLVEMEGLYVDQGREVLSNMFAENSDDCVTAVNERSIVLIKSFDREPDKEMLRKIGQQIVSMLNTELMVKVRVAYGNLSKELKDLSKSYKEAQMALEVAGIFSSDQEVAAYSALGIGRLIHQLPTSLCEIFLDEILKDKQVLNLEEEELAIINKFFDNNLNVSETARELFVHRNTLVYRLEKLQKQSGLDIRKFEDALTFKIALMVSRYLNYLNREQ